MVGNNFQIRKATRKVAKIKVNLSSPAGFGKTFGALKIAYGMTNDWSKICIIDSENHSADLYAHLGDYSVLTIDAPYSPERYIEAIETAETAGMEVIIIDSASHEWSGTGGCLEINESLGGTFAAWAKVTPRHRAFIDKILSSQCHIITTTRKKTDYLMEEGQNRQGKTVTSPKKVGLKDETRDGFEYEMTVALEIINDKHLCKASKDRTGLFDGKPEFVITEKTGQQILDWCQNGLDVATVIKQIKDCKTADELTSYMKASPFNQDTEVRKVASEKFYSFNPPLKPNQIPEITEEQLREAIRRIGAKEWGNCANQADFVKSIMDGFSLTQAQLNLIGEAVKV